MTTINKILVPLDFSVHSSSALMYAADLARLYNASLQLIHVFDIGLYSLADGMPMLAPEQFEELAADAEQRLDSAKRDAIAAGAQRVETKLLQGTPEVEVLQLAKQGAFDLIIMGTHGRTGFRHILLGSVAERIVRYAPCPVFTVKALAPSDASAADAAVSSKEIRS